MKVLGHIHCFNDEEVIDRSLQALLNQTYPLEEIVLVDNWSTDGTLTRTFPQRVRVIRHPENRGTSGSVATGFGYALAKGYDWIWLLEADSAPRKDALEKLVQLFQSLPEETQKQVWLLASLPMERPLWSVTSPFSLRLATFNGDPAPKPRHGITFTRKGSARVQPGPGQWFYECDATIWSGSLYKLAAVLQVGLPPANYVLDWGEYEYGYRGKRYGFRAFMHVGSIVDHNFTGQASLHFTTYRLGPLTFKMIELPPIRCYYVVRNTLYFWLYEYHVRNLSTLFPRLFKVCVLTFNFLVRPASRRRELLACLRGIRDGLLKKMHHRY